MVETVQQQSLQMVRMEEAMGEAQKMTTIYIFSLQSEEAILLLEIEVWEQTKTCTRRQLHGELPDSSILPLPVQRVPVFLCKTTPAANFASQEETASSHHNSLCFTCTHHVALLLFHLLLVAHLRLGKFVFLIWVFLQLLCFLCFSTNQTQIWAFLHLGIGDLKLAGFRFVTLPRFLQLATTILVGS